MCLEANNSNEYLSTKGEYMKNIQLLLHNGLASGGK